MCLVHVFVGVVSNISLQFRGIRQILDRQDIYVSDKVVDMFFSVSHGWVPMCCDFLRVPLEVCSTGGFISCFHVL